MQRRKGGIRSTLSLRKGLVPSIESIQLTQPIKPREISTPCTVTSSEQIIYSLSSQLVSDNSTRSRTNTSIFEHEQISISCLGELDMKFISDDNNQFDKIYKKVAKRLQKSVIYDLHIPIKDRKGCWDLQCPTKARWLSKLIFYEREVKNVEVLKTKQCPQQIIDQIMKDTPRSFPQNMFPKSKITVYHATSQKNCIYDTLKTILQLYAIHDFQVGYVQGINLIAAVIVIHMKDINSSFIFLKQLMYYGKLRSLYINDMKFVKQIVYEFFRAIFPSQIPDLYQLFTKLNIQPLILTSYYLSLFANVVDIHYMHLVIDQFMIDGVHFLHKFMISLLLYLRPSFLVTDDDTVTLMLGISWLKQADIPWQKILTVSQAIITTKTISPSRKIS